MVNRKSKKKRSREFDDPKPKKHVTFNDEIIIHMIDIEDRKGYWVEDMFRFRRRCVFISETISFIFNETHRQKMRMFINTSILHYESNISRGYISEQAR
jgi:hypothetical protein